MKKALTLAVLSITLLMFSSAFTPALAESQKFTAVLSIKTSISGVSQVHDTAPAKEWTTDGGITHKQGITRTVDFDTVNQLVKLKITYPTPIGEKTYIGRIQAFVDVMITKTGVTTNHYHKWVITFPVQPGLLVEGAFEGTNKWVIGPLPGATPPISYEGHAVLQGTGGFEGQTLSIAVDLQLNKNSNWYGYLMIR